MSQAESPLKQAANRLNESLDRLLAQETEKVGLLNKAVIATDESIEAAKRLNKTLQETVDLLRG